jgi:hypothetical protein
MSQPFNPQNWAKNGITEQQVIDAKASFDQFDDDHNGVLDVKGKKNII